LSFIIIFYVSYYSNSVDNLTTDLDYSASSLLIEAEKEIAAIDDLLMALVVVVFLFG